MVFSVESPIIWLANGTFHADHHIPIVETVIAMGKVIDKIIELGIKLGLLPRPVPVPVRKRPSS
jgi:hypothetical protein